MLIFCFCSAQTAIEKHSLSVHYVGGLHIVQYSARKKTGLVIKSSVLGMLTKDQLCLSLKVLPNKCKIEYELNILRMRLSEMIVVVLTFYI